MTDTMAALTNDGDTLNYEPTPSPSAPPPSGTRPSGADDATMPVRKVDTTTFGSAGAARYRLLQLLGEGGFGEVWLAEQTAPLQRKVALKVLKKGMDTKAIVERFVAEQAALNRLNHPSLAKVFDTGTTPEGLPFFAMEYVDGPPIDRYADQKELPVRDRIALLIQVAEAVHHAHSKGLVHRDLKPANVLVMAEGNGHRAKVIDFGIAKVVNAAGGNDSHTLVGQLLGSPDYMAPEQADGRDDIDTRADVWALGVVLYEVVTGSLPFQRGLFKAAGEAEWKRQLREVNPQRPSTRIRTGTGEAAGTTAAEIARQRAADTRTLIATVHGDLDWVIMRCLEKERDRRYSSAAALAEDLRRYLAGDAVEAGPPTVRYRAGKFLRKYRLAASLMAALLVLLVASSVVSTVLWRESESSLARANDTLDTIIGSLQTATPEDGGSPAQTFPTFLMSLEAQARDLATREPLVAASMLHAVGTLRLAAKDYEGAEPPLAFTVTLRRADEPQRLVEVELAALTVHDHARALFFLKRYPEARERYELALTLWDPVTQAGPRAESLRHLGSVYGQLKKSEESERAFSDALAITMLMYGEDSLEAAKSYYSRSGQFQREGRLDEAEADLLAGLQILRKQLTGKDYRIGSHLNRLAEIQVKRGQLERAATNYLEAVDHLVPLGLEHPTLVNARIESAKVLLTLGRPQEALEQATEALIARRRAFAPPALLVPVLDIASQAASAAGEWRLARQHTDAALDSQRDLAPGGSLLTGDLACRLAGILLRDGTDSERARRLLNEADEEARQAGGEAGTALAARVAQLRTSLPPPASVRE